MYRKYIKRIFDILISLVSLPFFLLMTAVVAGFIYMEDKGPVFYCAPRLGKNGKIYKMYKFRTMYLNSADIRNSDGSTYSSANDKRLTKTGKMLRKLSLDEIPQVLNILKGDMSIIGPRPDLPDHFDLYVDNESRKLEVTPGITGLNQAYYRNSIPWKERIKNDIVYIDNITFLLDVKILFKTVICVLRMEHIYHKVRPSSKKENSCSDSNGVDEDSVNSVIGR